MAADRDDAMVTLRRARAEDLEATYEVMVDANEDLNRRLGHPVDIRERSPRWRAMAVREALLASDPDRFWVAESGGEVVGFGMSTVRDRIWYLASLQVRPSHQSSGTGRALIERMLPSAVDVLLTVSEAANDHSNGLYGRLGMYPQSPLITLAGHPAGLAPDRLPRASSVPADIGTAELASIDRAVLGMRRDSEHACWSGMPGMRRIAVERGGRIRAYAYVDAAGMIGPAAGLEPGELAAVIGCVLALEAEHGRDVVRVQVPGVARPLLQALLAGGFRYQAGVNLVLSSRDFGQLDRYVTSGADSLF